MNVINVMNETADTPNKSYLKRISHSILNLPTLPTIAARLLELVDNPRTSANSISKLISEDQVLTAKLLKMVNSAYYGLGSEVTSIQQAIVLLGFDNVRELSLGVSVLNAFKSARGTQLLNMNDFWDHCAFVGVVSRSLAKRYAPELAPEAFTAGLLHDIGKVILIQYLAEEFGEALEHSKHEGKELFLAEEEIMGVSHGEVGSWLGEKWKLPHSLQECMKYHHHPQDSEEYPALCTLVSLADLLCRIMGAGNGGNAAPARIQPELAEMCRIHLRYELEPEALKLLVQQLLEEIEESQNLRADLLDV